MAVNYASKYSAQVDERFKIGALTNGAVNQNYDWVGVKTVNVYSVPTAAMNNYTRSGANRYGTPAELQNTVQELTLTRDRSFTFTIDRANYDDTMMSNSAGQALARQLDEVVIPEIDVYRLAAMVANAGTTETADITSSNAFEVFLDAQIALTDAKVPVAGRMVYVSPKYYKLIKLDPSFIKASDMAQDMLLKGQVGQIDGVPTILTPTSYLPTDVEFIVTHQIATVSPTKLQDYKIHDNPPGINGWLVEGRIYYDAFVLDNKAPAIYVHKSEALGG